MPAAVRRWPALFRSDGRLSRHRLGYGVAPARRRTVEEKRLGNASDYPVLTCFISFVGRPASTRAVAEPAFARSAQMHLIEHLPVDEAVPISAARQFRSRCGVRRWPDTAQRAGGHHHRSRSSGIHRHDGG